MSAANSLTWTQRSPWPGVMFGSIIPIVVAHRFVYALRVHMCTPNCTYPCSFGSLTEVICTSGRRASSRPCVVRLHARA